MLVDLLHPLAMIQWEEKKNVEFIDRGCMKQSLVFTGKLLIRTYHGQGCSLHEFSSDLSGL